MLSPFDADSLWEDKQPADYILDCNTRAFRLNAKRNPISLTAVDA